MWSYKSLNKKGEEGITLIALVVTLVVLLILAAITINFLVGDNGIFKTANDAKIQHRIGEILDELNVAESSVSLQKLGKTTLEEYIQYIQEQNIVAQVEEQEDGSYLVTTEDGYVFQISIIEGTSVNDIVIGYVGTANGPRIKAIHVTGNTTNSISVEVETANSEGATYKYEYRKDGEDDNSWKLAEESKSATCMITGLAGNQIYDIKVTVTTSEGSASKITSDTTGELEVGTIEFEEYEWQGDGTASIVIRNNSTDPSYHLEYRIGVDGQWTEITSGQEITGLIHGQTVYGRLYDGVNEASPANVEILDETIPEEATIQLGATTANIGETITAIVTHIDNQSGVDINNCKWAYSTQKAEMGTEEADLSKYTGTFSNNGASINLNASNQGTYYLHVLTVDKTGKARETISDSITVSQLITGITVNPASITLDEGETQQLTVNITPSDSTNKTVTWSSSNSNIASVNSTGLVTAKTEGIATITAKTTDGSNKTASCSITVLSADSVNHVLKAGDYVYYYDKSNTRRICVVLYDASSNYGVQIITMDTVEDVELGNGTNNSSESYNNITDFNRAMNSYNSAISTLNTRAAAYQNSTYASNARCVGSNPSNINSQGGYYTRSEDWFSNYNSKLRNTDQNYEKDWDKMIELKIDGIDKEYWLASRNINHYSGRSEFCIRYTDIFSAELCEVRDTEYVSSYSIKKGLRPVFTIRPTVKVTGGNGSENNPYTLGI